MGPFPFLRLAMGTEWIPDRKPKPEPSTLNPKPYKGSELVLKIPGAVLGQPRVLNRGASRKKRVGVDRPNLPVFSTWTLDTKCTYDIGLLDSV